VIVPDELGVGRHARQHGAEDREGTGARGVIAMASSKRGLAEEQPKAYKNVDDVVDVVHEADLSRKVARMRPIGVIKG